MNIRVGLARSLVYIVVGYLFLFAAALVWHVLIGPPYERGSLPLVIALGLCVALVNLLMIWTALVSLHWPKRLAGVVVGIAVIAGILMGIFQFPVFFLWQLIVELAVAMGLQIVAFAGAHLAGYRLLRRCESSAEETVPDRPAPRLSVRDLFLLITSFALLFAALRLLQPATLPVWGYWLLFICSCSIALLAIAVVWGVLSEAHWLLRGAVLAMTGPGAWIIYYLLAQRYSLLYSAWFYFAVAVLAALLMSAPLSLVRASGFRIVRALNNVGIASAAELGGDA